MVAKTPLDAARRFHYDFYGTARGEIAVVGDFDAKQIEVLVNELFTDYRSKAPYARLDREYREVKPARLTVDTPEKENAFIRARIDFPLRDDDPDAPALMLADDIFGGGAGMSNRVIERLRQKDGISYGAGTGLMLGSRYRLASWTLGADARRKMRSRRSRRSARRSSARGAMASRPRNWRTRRRARCRSARPTARRTACSRMRGPPIWISDAPLPFQSSSRIDCAR